MCLSLSLCYYSLRITGFGARPFQLVIDVESQISCLPLEIVAETWLEFGDGVGNGSSSVLCTHPILFGSEPVIVQLCRLR